MYGSERERERDGGRDWGRDGDGSWVGSLGVVVTGVCVCVDIVMLCDVVAVIGICNKL